MIENDKYDVVVVGSGLGGLISGCILSKEGYKVCVVEKHYQIGGCLQDFKRKGHFFDTGMHYIGSYDEGQVLNRLFKYFGIFDDIIAEKLEEDKFDIIHYGGNTVHYAQGVENFTNTLIKQFPDERVAIETYVAKIVEVENSIDLINLREVNTFNYDVIDSMGINVYDYIASLTDNIELQNALGGLNSLYAGEKHTSSLYMHAIINMFYIKSAWRLIGGGGQIAKALRKVIESNNGVVREKSEVVQFKFEGKEISSVLLKNGEEIFAKTFISNVHPVVTMKLLEPGHMRKAYVNRINALKNTVSTFSVYAVLKEKSFKYENSNIYYYKENNVWGLTDNTEENWPLGFMMYATESTEHKGYASSLTILSTMFYKDVAKWENTTIEKRGDDYKQMKKVKGEQLLDLVSEKYANIRDDIDAYFTSTPLTYRDYTGTVDGSMYGIAQDCNKPMESFLLPKTRVPNLLLTGQNINMHGILGVSLVAISTCGELLGVNNIIKKINDETK